MVNNSGMNDNETCYVCFSIFVMIACIAAIPLAIVVHPAILATFVLLCIYWCCSCATSATKYIENLTELKTFQRDTQKAIQSRPDCCLTIQNYHYETRTTTSTDSDGNTTTSTETVTVNTHYATEPFEFSKW